jgi:hypothetical protein
MNFRTDVAAAPGFLSSAGFEMTSAKAERRISSRNPRGVQDGTTK